MNAIQQAHDRMTTPQIWNFLCVSGAVLWTLWLFLIFVQHFSCYNPRTSSVLRSLLTLVSAPVVPSDKTAWSKGSNRLGASCLKTEAERASETWCFSIKKNGKDPRQEDYLHGDAVASTVCTDGVTYTSVLHTLYDNLSVDSTIPLISMSH
jgi:hypothetical protein